MDNIAMYRNHESTYTIEPGIDNEIDQIFEDIIDERYIVNKPYSKIVGYINTTPQKGE